MREKIKDCLGTLGPKERHSNNVPGFSFCLFYATLGAEKNSNLEMLTAADKESPRKCSSLQVVKGLGKEEPNKSFR